MYVTVIKSSRYVPTCNPNCSILLLLSSLLRCGACTQLSRDILTVGDVWSVDLSPLELQNAETKRIANSSGSRHIELRQEGQSLVGLKSDTQGPKKLVKTKGYSTTMALSTLTHLLITQKLRRGDGPFTMPECRRSERLFGDHGRTKLLSAGVKHEKLGDDYDPTQDTCLAAFIRLLAIAATTDVSEL